MTKNCKKSQLAQKIVRLAIFRVLRKIASLLLLRADLDKSGCIAPTFMMSWPSAQYAFLLLLSWDKAPCHKQAFVAGVLKNHNVQL